MVADLSEHEVSKEATLASCCILTFVLLLTSGFDTVLALRVWLIGLLILLGLTSLEFISVNLDWALNPWVEDAEMSWSSFLTTKHYFTWLTFKM